MPESAPISRSPVICWVVRHLALLVFVGFLALYAVTLLPDVLPADSGEFQRVATTAEVAHPPGYPLYAMLGWLFTRLPLGPTPAWRVNFLSAVTAAATVALLFHTAYCLTDSLWGALASSLALGSATTFWATATKASIRPLTAFFTVLCLYTLIRYRAVGARRSVVYYLVIFALTLSLGLTHHASLAFSALVFVFYLVMIDPALFYHPRRWVRPILAFLLGLSVLIYLPLRGGPDLSTLAGFLDHVLARGFRGDMFALNLFDRMVLLLTLMRFQFNGVLLVGALLGALILLRRDWKLTLLLIGSFLVHTAVTLTYDAPQTVEYLMPAYVPLTLLLAIPFGVRPKPGARCPIGKRVIRLMHYVVLIVLLVAGVTNVVTHLPSYLTRSQSHDTRVYTETLLRKAPEGAVILANWHWFTPLRYLQRIEGQRPDVEVEYVHPRGEPLADTWVRRIEAHVSQRPVIAARYFEREYNALPYRFEPLGEAFLVRPEPRRNVPVDLQVMDATLGGEVDLLGYRVDRRANEPSRPFTLTLAWSPAASLTSDVALFAQLIGPEGRLWSVSRDSRRSAARLDEGEVVIERFTVYPLLHAMPGDYDLVVGAYRPSEPGAPRLSTADGAEVVGLESMRIRPSTTRPVTKHPRLVRFVGGPTLVGVDYDLTPAGGVRVYLHWAGPGPGSPLIMAGAEDAAFTTGQVPALKRGQYATVVVDRPGIPDRVWLPDEGDPHRWNFFFRGVVPLPTPKDDERYVPFGDQMVLTGASGPVRALEPGREVTLQLHLRGQRPLKRDYVVSVGLTGFNPDRSWAWRDTHDTVPALGAIPTLKWIRGSKVLDPHHLTIPAETSAVPVEGTLSIYDHFTQQVLLPLDDRLDWAVSLGDWVIGS